MTVPGTGLGEVLGEGLKIGAATGLQNLLATYQQEQAAKAKQQQNAAFNSQLTKLLLGSQTDEDLLTEPADPKKEIPSESIALSPEQNLQLFKLKSELDKNKLANEKFAADETRKQREQILDSANKATKLKKSVGNIRQLLEKTSSGPFSFDSIMFKIGLKGAASPEAQAFQANLLDFLEGAREKFGVRLTDADLKLVLDKLPDIARTKEGNKLILDLFESQADLEIFKKKAMNNVIKSSKGIPRNFDEKFEIELNKLIDANKPIENKFEESASKLTEIATGKKPARKSGETIRIKLPDGRIGSVPAERLEEFIKVGATKL